MALPFKVCLIKSRWGYRLRKISARGEGCEGRQFPKKRDWPIAPIARRFGRRLCWPGLRFWGLECRVLRLWRQICRLEKGTVAIEFAILILPFCLMMLLIFTLGLHFFYQELLDSGLNTAVRQIQTGNAQNIPNGNTFVSSYLYPAAGKMLTCANIHINVQQITFSGTQDFYNYTTGTLPGSNGALNLAGFAFSNPGPSEFILVTAVYLAPSFMGGFLPNVFSVTYNGSQADAIMSQVATYTESFTAVAAAPAASSC